MRIIGLGLIGALTLSAQSIRLERSSCFGSCPVYSIRIEAPGKVVYEGKNFVATIGTHNGLIREDQFQKLIRQIHDMNFFDLRPEYTAGITDMPTTTVTFTEGGHAKAVRDYYGAPPQLTELERDIERTVNSHQWLHTRNNRLTLATPAAGSGGSFTTVEDLKQFGVARSDAYQWIKSGVTALMYAAGLGKVEFVRDELAKRPDLNAADETGWTALMIASSSDFVDSVRLLLQAGANPNRKDFHGDTALIGAAAAAQFDQHGPEILSLLMGHGARVDETNDLGESALMWASRAGNPEAIAILLKHGANRKKLDRAGHDANFYLLQARALMTFDKTLETKYDRAATVLNRVN